MITKKKSYIQPVCYIADIAQMPMLAGSITVCYDPHGETNEALSRRMDIWGENIDEDISF